MPRVCIKNLPFNGTKGQASGLWDWWMIPFFSTNPSWTTIQNPSGPSVQPQFRWCHIASWAGRPASRTMVSLTWRSWWNILVVHGSAENGPSPPGGSGFSRKGNLPSRPWRRVRSWQLSRNEVTRSLLSFDDPCVKCSPLWEMQCGCFWSTCHLQRVVT